MPLGLGTCDYPFKYRRRLKGFLGVERSYIRSHGSLLDQLISTVRGLRGMWVYVQANRCYLAIQHVLVDKRDMCWAITSVSIITFLSALCIFTGFKRVVNTIGWDVLEEGLLCHSNFNVTNKRIIGNIEDSQFYGGLGLIHIWGALDRH